MYIGFVSESILIRVIYGKINDDVFGRIGVKCHRLLSVEICTSIISTLPTVIEEDFLSSDLSIDFKLLQSLATE